MPGWDMIHDWETEEILTRRKDIQKSITKQYKKTIWRKFVMAISRYELVQPGDKIAVCISGGKDSMLLALLFQELQRHRQIPFEVVYLCMNPGYKDENYQNIVDNAKLLGIPLTTFETDIFDVVTDISNSPCFLCARMRRGYLYDQAKQLGCNKIALGHHFDDMIETVLMGMLYSGKIETMMPKLHSKHFAGMELIRPMYLIKEEAILSWRDENDLKFILCACKYTEKLQQIGEEHTSKRAEMKGLIRHFREISDVVDVNIFKSVHNVDLRKILGYCRDEEEYFFLDDYEELGEEIRRNIDE